MFTNVCAREKRLQPFDPTLASDRACDMEFMATPCDTQNGSVKVHEDAGEEVASTPANVIKLAIQERAAVSAAKNVLRVLGSETWLSSVKESALHSVLRKLSSFA